MNVTTVCINQLQNTQKINMLVVLTFLGETNVKKGKMFWKIRYYYYFVDES